MEDDPDELTDAEAIAVVLVGLIGAQSAHLRGDDDQARGVMEKLKEWVEATGIAETVRALDPRTSGVLDLTWIDEDDENPGE